MLALVITTLILWLGGAFLGMSDSLIINYIYCIVTIIVFFPIITFQLDQPRGTLH